MAVSAFIAATHRSLEAFLRWVDWLSAAPGLSGLVLLLLSPFALLALLFVVHWAYAPFAGEAPRDSAC